MPRVTGRGPKGTGGPRLSITVPPDEHSELQRIAEENRVSIAWVVRDAVTKYLADSQRSSDKKTTPHSRAPR